MYSINPLNVLKLLEEEYKLRYQPDDAPSDADKQLKDLIKDLIDIKIARSDSPVLEVEEDLQGDLQLDGLTFDDFEKTAGGADLLNGSAERYFFEDDRLNEPVTSDTEPSSHEIFVPRLPDSRVPSSQAVNLDYKKRAVDYWCNDTAKKRRSLSSVRNHFTKVRDERQLRDWKKQLAGGGSRFDKLKVIRFETAKQYFMAKQKRQVVKDLNLQRWAIPANNDVDLPGFTASPYWVSKFKRYYGIFDRKITKFVTKKSLEAAPQVKQSAEECVALVRSRIAEHGLDCLWNTDQSGVGYEMRPGRTLEQKGVKPVEAITQSENSMTHSYTVMMTISPGTRKFHPILFITPKEEKGVFGPIVSKTMFKADDLYITASTSGKMTKKPYLEWSEKVLFPHMEDRCILLADSWKTFTDQDAVIELKPEELQYEMITIPPKISLRGRK
ncbi:hypothetical protein RvY_16475 [Ramazzottius varieornatus]|uniref:HTH CENPB-type domain-containing protein n=1 Tax=Ramazzottius varieornatus TaxID=947166 RepID=A0A1D1W655_RAMVA|nr:hypothetical protein RvY_16475 [Ramazzottius varieornatus]